MLDPKFIRENPELVKENIRKKFQDKEKIVDEFIKRFDEWRAIKQEGDKLRQRRNTISKEVSEAKKKKDEKLASKLIEESKKNLENIEANEKLAEDTWIKVRELQEKIPNIISKDVPIGKDDSENVVEETFGNPKKPNFEIVNHAELIENLGMGDFDSSARVAGKGFYYISGDIALLNQALIQYAIKTMVKKGFTYVETPLMLRGDIIKKVTDLHDQQNMVYKIEGEDLYLIGTSEHSLIGRFAGQNVEPKELPIKHTSYSMCFRKEIGSHGVDEKGLFRTHQFNKVEMIVICMPEESEKFFEEMKKITLEIFTGLEVPVRVLGICSGDLGDLKYRQIDVEVYSPRKDAFFEVGSCSNLTSSQARKLNITTFVGGERTFPHTLNNTAIATSRALVAVLENHQQKDGTIIIPKVLREFMGKDKIVPQ